MEFSRVALLVHSFQVELELDCWFLGGRKTERHGEKTLQAITCSAGVLLGRVNVTNLVIVYSTTSDLEIQAAVEGRAKNIHSPTPTPLLIFDCHSPPWYKPSQPSSAI